METESQAVLRRAKEALAYYREKENQAIINLASAREDTRNAREKYEKLFLKKKSEKRSAAEMTPNDPS